MEWLTLAAGAYLTGLAFAVNATGLLAQVVFRAIPGVIGIGLIFGGSKMAGWL